MCNILSKSSTEIPTPNGLVNYIFSFGTRVMSNFFAFSGQCWEYSGHPINIKLYDLKL